MVGEKLTDIRPDCHSPSLKKFRQSANFVISGITHLFMKVMNFKVFLWSYPWDFPYIFSDPKIGLLRLLTKQNDSLSPD